MTHDCNQNIESNMAPAHCRVCGMALAQEKLDTLKDQIDDNLRNTIHPLYMTQDKNDLVTCPDCGEIYDEWDTMCEECPGCGEACPKDRDTVMPQDKSVEEQIIKDAVTRFLGWKLPATFSPDGGISYDPNVCETVGTHLFTAQEATEMVRYILRDSLTTTRQQVREEALRELSDAAEMLWVVLANVSGGDWSQQNQEWQEAAQKWRDNYFSVKWKPQSNPTQV